MKNQEPRIYEGMYIANAALSDDARSKFLEKIKSGISNLGGEILKVFDQGRRKLAYEIRDRREGYYYLLYFSIVPSAVKEMWNEYHLNEDLLRYITLQVESVPEKIEFKPLGEE